MKNKPFQCDICENKCSQKSTINQHFLKKRSLFNALMLLLPSMKKHMTNIHEEKSSENAYFLKNLFMRIIDA